MSEKFNRTDFLEAIFGTHSEETGSFILIRTVDDGGSRLSNHFYPNTRQLSTAAFLPNRHVYFGVCPRQRMTLSGEHIRFATTLWASIDIGPGGYSGVNNNFADLPEARKAVESFPISPSIIVQSGRGLHLYWLLESPKEITNVEIVEDLLRKLNSHFRCDSPVGVDSTLRLPETWNPRGYRTSVRCLVEHLDSGLRYHPRDFQDLDRLIIGVPGSVPPKKVPSETASVPAVSAKPAAKDEATGLHEPAGRTSLDPMVSAPKMLCDTRELPTERESANGSRPVHEEDKGLPLGLTGEALDALADRVAERVSRNFLSNQEDLLVDRIADKIVQKLALSIRLTRDT